MEATSVSMKRTPWDVIVGILLIIAGFVLLGNVVVATAVSVWLTGWMTLASGLVLFFGGLFRIRKGGAWSAVLGGAMLSVIGLFILRNIAVTAVALTLLAGAMFFSSGLVRIALGVTLKAARWPVIISGLISTGLGLYVLFNLAPASAQLLGIMLGIQTLLEGVTLIAVGRLRASDEAADAADATARHSAPAAA